MKVSKRVDLRSSYHKNNFYSYVWWWTLTRLTVVIILQYIKMSDHYTVHLKLIKCYMSIIAQYFKKSGQWLYVSGWKRGKEETYRKCPSYWQCSDFWYGWLLHRCSSWYYSLRCVFCIIYSCITWFIILF